MKLYSVRVEIFLDAENEKDAIDKVDKFMEGKIELDLNYLMRDVDIDEDFNSLNDMRN